MGSRRPPKPPKPHGDPPQNPHGHPQTHMENPQNHTEHPKPPLIHRGAPKNPLKNPIDTPKTPMETPKTTRPPPSRAPRRPPPIQPNPFAGPPQGRRRSGVFNKPHFFGESWHYFDGEYDPPPTPPNLQKYSRGGGLAPQIPSPPPIAGWFWQSPPPASPPFFGGLRDRGDAGGAGQWGGGVVQTCLCPPKM